MDFSYRSAAGVERGRAAKVDIPMMRLCAVLVLSLLGGLISVHAAPAPHPHWSVGFHRMTFLDPLDLQPMKAIAFYPSTDDEHSTALGAYHVAATEDSKVAIGRFPMLMLSHGNTVRHWPCTTWPRLWHARVLSWWPCCTLATTTRITAAWAP